MTIANLDYPLRFTAHSLDMLTDLAENDKDSTAVAWMKANSDLLHGEFERLERGLRGALKSGSRILVLVPVTPTASGVYVGHHVTYRAAARFCAGLNAACGRPLVTVKAVFLNQRSSLFMTHHPVNESYYLKSEAGADAKRLLDSRRLRKLRPNYLADHMHVMTQYIELATSDVGEGVDKVPVRHCLESHLYRDLMAEDASMEITRQALWLLSNEGQSNGAAIDLISPEHGIDLTAESLCSVLLHSEQVIQDGDDIHDYCVLFCGGDMFANLLEIRSMLFDAFAGQTRFGSLCDTLNDLPIITTPCADSIRFASMAGPTVIDRYFMKDPESAHYEYKETANFEELIRAGDAVQQEAVGVEVPPLRDEDVERFSRELEIFIGPDVKGEPAIQMYPRNRVLMISSIEKLKGLSRITPKSALVLKVIHNRGIGEGNKLVTTTKSEIFREIGVEDKAVEKSTESTITRKGLTKILTNLLELEIIREHEDKSYSFDKTTFVIDFDTMLKSD